jgi:signal peptidase II
MDPAWPFIPGMRLRVTVVITISSICFSDSCEAPRRIRRRRRCGNCTAPPGHAGDGAGYGGRVQAAAFRTAGARRAVGGITAFVLAADQLSKSLVLAAHPGGGGGLVSVRVVRNTGASFGIGSGHPLLVVAASAAVIAVVAVLLARVRSRPAALLLAVVLGGALGNLADRLFRSPGLGRGAVVDWIHVAGYPATFNLADVAIRAGAAAAFLGAGAHLGDRLRPRRWPSLRRGAPGSAPDG